MIWDAPEREEYPSVRAFANKMKLTIMDAHDAIMKTRVKQTVGANKKRRECPLVKGDLVRSWRTSATTLIVSSSLTIQ